MAEGTSGAPGKGGADPYEWNNDNYYKKAHLRLRTVSTLIRSIFENRPGASVLDVGCGHAALGRLLGGAFDYYGCDGYDGLFGGDQPSQNVQHWVYDEAKPCLPFGGRSFDAVVCSGFIEYVSGRPVFLAQIRERLKEDGVLAISLVNFFRIDRRLAAMASGFGLPAGKFFHEQWRAPIASPDFMDMLDGAGLPVQAGVALPFHTRDGQSRTLSVLPEGKLRGRLASMRRHFETQVVFLASAKPISSLQPKYFIR